MFNKISHRLFVYIFAIVFIILTLVFAFQMLFLEEWYLNSKIDTMISDINELSENLEFSSIAYEDAYQLTEEFMEVNDVSVIIDEGIFFEEFYGDDILMEEIINITNLRVRDELGRFYYAFIEISDDEIVEELFEFLHEGEEVELKGYAEEETIFVAEINGIAIEEYDPYEINTDQTFIIMDIETTMVENTYIQSNIIDVDLLDVEAEVDVDDTLTYYIYREPFTNAKRILFQKLVHYADREETLMLVESSLVGVSEVMAIMQPFYIMFYCLAAVLAIVFTVVVSRRISRPIVLMQQKAEAMSHMDFENEIVVRGNDELSSLATSINSLSGNLKETIDNLKQSNSDLYAEMEKEKLNEARRLEFISNVSHDLKTPIGIAKGYLEAIKVQLRDDKRDEYLDITLGEMDKMNKIVVDMLQVLRMEGQEAGINLSRQAIKPIIMDTVDYFFLMAQEKEMVIDVVGDVKSAMIDVKTFKSLWMNLLSNGIKYGKAGSEIAITLKEDNNQVELMISNMVDHPENIDMDEIWHKFYTKDKSRNRLTSGTGLGMSLIKGILNQYDSEYSASVLGSRFVFKFTLKK